MRYWLNTLNGEWGIVRGSEESDLALSGPVGTLVADQVKKTNPQTHKHDAMEKDPNLLVLEKAVFLKIYENLERISFTPIYSPLQPVARN